MATKAQIAAADAAAMDVVLRAGAAAWAAASEASRLKRTPTQERTTMTGPFVRCGACGKKGAYQVFGWDGNADTRRVRCRSCGADKTVWHTDWEGLEPAAAALTEGDRR